METYRGHVRSPADAIKLFEACRLGLLPRVQRRLSEKERQSITSGSVFVWDEREAGMRRWTDGKSWSASRVSGSFLTYREMEGKRGGGNFVPAPTRRVPGKTPDSGRGSDEDAEMDGEGPDGYRYKPDGLMKQSFSITTSAGQHLHLISYYARPHSNGVDLLQPTLDPALRHIVPVKGMYPESTVHEQAQGPAVTRAPMAGAYMTSAPHMAPGPMPPHGRAAYTPYNGPPGYNWPPSPVATPPYNYPPAHYPSQLPPPPPPGSGHPSPHQFSPHHHPHAHTSAPPPPHPTAFDRLPPPLSDSSLPPPPPSAAPAGGHRHTNSGPTYPQNLSPHLSQARLVAEQQAQQAQRFAQQAMPAPSLIDPRIMNPSIASAPQTNGHSSSQTSSPSASTPLPNGQSQPQNIPSISSLVHADDTKTPASSRHGSSSPKDGASGPTSVEGGKPQDIPHAKLGFGGEDIRALRVLDRKFCT